MSDRIRHRIRRSKLELLTRMGIAAKRHKRHKKKMCWPFYITSMVDIEAAIGAFHAKDHGLLQQDGLFANCCGCGTFKSMFVYSPPKASIWGHALRPKDPQKAAEGLQRFFETYFEGPYQLDPSGAYELSWRESALPNIDWDPSLLLPENERFKKVSFLMSSLSGERVSFPLGLLIPISPSDPASYEFLEKLCRDAPFKFSVKHFKVGIPTGNKGKLKYVKATGETAARLAMAMEQT